MNLKPMLLGIVAAALVTTAVVKLTSEGDKVVYAPAPVVEAVPAPMPPVRPAPVVKRAPRAAPALKAAAKCPARLAH